MFYYFKKDYLTVYWTLIFADQPRKAIKGQCHNNWLSLLAMGGYGCSRERGWRHSILLQLSLGKWSRVCSECLQKQTWVCSESVYLQLESLETKWSLSLTGALFTTRQQKTKTDSRFIGNSAVLELSFVGTESRRGENKCKILIDFSCNCIRNSCQRWSKVGPDCSVHLKRSLFHLKAVWQLQNYFSLTEWNKFLKKLVHVRNPWSIPFADVSHRKSKRYRCDQPISVSPTLLPVSKHLPSHLKRLPL